MDEWTESSVRGLSHSDLASPVFETSIFHFYIYINMVFSAVLSLAIYFYTDIN